MSNAELVRAAADGEIPLEAAQVVPGAAQRIAFERGLRSSVGRVMSAHAAPADLRARIVRDMGAVRGEAPSAAIGAAQDQPSIPDRAVRASELLTDAPAPIPFPAPRMLARWWLAAAAAIAMGAALLLLKPGAPQVASQSTTSFVAFTTSQHAACAEFGEFFDRKMTARTEADATKAAIELLHKVPEALDLRSDALSDAGYRFAGLGECHVPGKGRSAHLVYRADPTLSPNAPPVSLFVQEDSGEMNLETSFAYQRLCPKTRCQVSVWRKDGLVYYLVTPQGTPANVPAAFDEPQPHRQLL